MEIDLDVDVSRNLQKENRRTYWKLNTSILKDDEFLDNFSDLWTWLKSLKNDYSDIADWWDAVVKPSIKDFCVLFSSRRSKRRRDSKRFWFAYLRLFFKQRIGKRLLE